MMRLNELRFVVVANALLLYERKLTTSFISGPLGERHNISDSLNQDRDMQPAWKPISRMSFRHTFCVYVCVCVWMYVSLCISVCVLILFIIPSLPQLFNIVRRVNMCLRMHEVNCQQADNFWQIGHNVVKVPTPWSFIEINARLLSLELFVCAEWNVGIFGTRQRLCGWSYGAPWVGRKWSRQKIIVVNSSHCLTSLRLVVIEKNVGDTRFMMTGK